MKRRKVTYQTIEPDKRPGWLRGHLNGIALFVFSVIFFAVIAFNAQSLKTTIHGLESQQQDLEEQIQEEKAKSLQNKVDQSYYQSDKYKEEMARNRFRLIYPGDILIQINK